MVAHNTLTDPELHEPKGISIATPGSIYVANGSGGGSWTSRLVVGTAQATTASTIDFTGIPSWVNNIRITFTGVTHSGTGVPLVQVGTSSGLVTTGYTSGSATIDNTSVQSIGSTSGMTMYGQGGESKSGSLSITRQSGNTWISTHNLSRGTGAGAIASGAGTIALGGALDRVRLLLNAAGAYTAGSVNIMWE